MSKNIFMAKYGTREDIEKILRVKDDPYSKEKVFENPLHNRKDVDAAMESKSANVVGTALSSPHATQEHAMRAMEHKNAPLKIAVLRSPRFTPAIMLKGLRDPDHKISAYAWKLGVNMGMVHHANKTSVIDALLDNEDPRIRDHVRSGMFDGYHTKEQTMRMTQDKSALIRKHGEEGLRINMDRWNRERLERLKGGEDE